MNKRALLVIVVFIVIVILGGYLFFYTRATSYGGLKVASSPNSSIFLNDELIGNSPYEGKHASGEYILKLIPEQSDQQASWQGKININPSLLTYVERNLGESELMSSGVILSLEKFNGGSSQIAIFSSPDAATVLLDGQDKGITPLLLQDISSGEYEMSISSPGFNEKTVKVQTTEGFKLSVNVQLELSDTPEATESAGIDKEKDEDDDKNTETKKEGTTNVVISDTPTGFLRVREDASTSSKELSQVKPGDKFEVLDEVSGWYKIEYEDGEEGWISGRYADEE